MERTRLTLDKGAVGDAKVQGVSLSSTVGDVALCAAASRYARAAWIAGNAPVAAARGERSERHAHPIARAVAGSFRESR